MDSILFVSDHSRDFLSQLICEDIPSPGSYDDVVDMLVPILQRRGLMWEDYTVSGGTYLENLHNAPGNFT